MVVLAGVDDLLIPQADREVSVSKPRYLLPALPKYIVFPVETVHVLTFIGIIIALFIILYSGDFIYYHFHGNSAL